MFRSNSLFKLSLFSLLTKGLDPTFVPTDVPRFWSSSHQSIHLPVGPKNLASDFGGFDGREQAETGFFLWKAGWIISPWNWSLSVHGKFVECDLASLLLLTDNIQGTLSHSPSVNGLSGVWNAYFAIDRLPLGFKCNHIKTPGWWFSWNDLKYIAIDFGDCQNKSMNHLYFEISTINQNHAPSTITACSWDSWKKTPVTFHWQTKVYGNNRCLGKRWKLMMFRKVPASVLRKWWN